MVYFLTFFTKIVHKKREGFMLHVEQKNVSGSGYDDLRGSVINYGYDFFDDFCLTVYNNKIKWSGQLGYYRSISQEVTPQISKIANDVYFLSWETEHGRDNVVLNFATQKARSHVSYTQFPHTLLRLHGRVYSVNAQDSEYPHLPLSNAHDIPTLIAQNIEERELPPHDRILETASLPKPEDEKIRQDFTGKTLTIATQFGMLQVLFSGAVMTVIENALQYIFSTTISQVNEHIYFISWDNAQHKGHIVCNFETMRAYRHMRPNGERREEICVITSFE